MLQPLKDNLRRQLRAYRRAGHYPILLPHAQLKPEGLITPNQPPRPLVQAMRKALELCDGTRSVAQVAHEAGVSRMQIICAHEDGLVVLWRSPAASEAPVLQRSPHLIILSPHLDDAALSCGGRLLGGEPALVVNVFGRGAWWRFPHTQDDYQRIQACRRAEEQMVSRLSHVPVQDLDLPEALLRGHAFDQIFSAATDARDAAAHAAVSEAVTALHHKYPWAHFFLPLGIGGHIDHRIVRDAALETLLEEGVAAAHLHLYEDQPYAARGQASDFFEKRPDLKLERQVLNIDNVLPWKAELLRVYYSQLRYSEIAEVQRYALLAGNGRAAEVAWTPSATAALSQVA